MKEIYNDFQNKAYMYILRKEKERPSNLITSSSHVVLLHKVSKNQIIGSSNF